MPNTSDLTPPKVNPSFNTHAGTDFWFPFFSWIPDFSGKLEPLFPSPGPVIPNPQKGNPVPAPGNPASEGGSQTSGIAGQVTEGIQKALQSFFPTAGQKRDYAVYGLALIVFVIAVAAILK